MQTCEYGNESKRVIRSVLGQEARTPYSRWNEADHGRATNVIGLTVYLGYLPRKEPGISNALSVGSSCAEGDGTFPDEDGGR